MTLFCPVSFFHTKTVHTYIHTYIHIIIYILTIHFNINMLQGLNIITDINLTHSSAAAGKKKKNPSIIYIKSPQQGIFHYWFATWLLCVILHFFYLILHVVVNCIFSDWLLIVNFGFSLVMLFWGVLLYSFFFV
jgi:hypothetical protein